METVVLLERVATVVCGGYNLAYFIRSWRTVAHRGGLRRNGNNGRRVALAVLGLTNLAFVTVALGPLLAAPVPSHTWGPGAQALAGLFPLAAALAMTVLVLRAQTRG